MRLSCVHLLRSIKSLFPALLQTSAALISPLEAVEVPVDETNHKLQADTQVREGGKGEEGDGNGSRQRFHMEIGKPIDVASAAGHLLRLTFRC